MTEDERKIRSWRNERRNGCAFPTQTSYDDARSALAKLKERYMNHDLSSMEAAYELVVFHKFGKQGANNVVRKWEEERGSA